jgi:hypothetical protein
MWALGAVSHAQVGFVMRLDVTGQKVLGCGCYVGRWTDADRPILGDLEAGGWRWGALGN